MGLLGRIFRHRMCKATTTLKNALTIVPFDDTFMADDHESDEVVYVLFSEEPLSPRHGITTTMPICSSPKKIIHFFEDNEETGNETQQDRDDLELLHDYDLRGGLALVESESSDYMSENGDERDDFGLLSGISYDHDLTGLFAYDFDQFEEEIIFEPSFEVALLDPERFERLMINSAAMIEQTSLQDTSPPKVAVGRSDEHKALDKVDAPALQPALVQGCQPRPKKRYDRKGRAFTHVFHDGLSTLHEEDSHASFESDLYLQKEPRPVLQELYNALARTNINLQKETNRCRPDLSDEAKIRARWEYALATMEGVRTPELDGICYSRPESPHGRRRSGRGYEV